MKKLALFIVILVLSFAVTGCKANSQNQPQNQSNSQSQSKQSNNGKLLESIKTDDVMQKFVYDDQNRLTDIQNFYNDSYNTTFSIKYRGADLISYEEDSTISTIERNGNTLTVHLDAPNSSEKYKLTVNADGYIIKGESIESYQEGHGLSKSNIISTYEYTGNNLVKVTYQGSTTVLAYKYDDKKSPFANSNTPKWFLQNFLIPHFGFNNVTENSQKWYNGVSEMITYKYEYDSEGFPTKRITTSNNNSNATITTFTYTGKVENPPETQQANITALTPHKIGEFASIDPALGEALYPYKDDPNGNTFHFWGFASGGDSQWDFGQYHEEFSASSALAPNKNVTYEAKNLSNSKGSGGNRATTWCEGVKGYGINERVNMTIKTLSDQPQYDDKVRLSSIMIVNGYAKDTTTWKNNSRVKTLRLYVSGEPLCELQLQDVIKPQIFSIPTNLEIYPKKHGKSIPIDKNIFSTYPAHTQSNMTAYQLELSFEIIDIYKGDKYDDTCITGIAFDVEADLY